MCNSGIESTIVEGVSLPFNSPFASIDYILFGFGFIAVCCIVSGVLGEMGCADACHQVRPERRGSWASRAVLWCVSHDELDFHVLNCEWLLLRQVFCFVLYSYLLLGRVINAPELYLALI